MCHRCSPISKVLLDSRLLSSSVLKKECTSETICQVLMYCPTAYFGPIGLSEKQYYCAHLLVREKARDEYCNCHLCPGNKYMQDGLKRINL